MLENKTVVLGVTGSISVYKAVDLASRLTQAGARVEVVMTRAATEFLTPVTFRAITGRPVITEMFRPASEFSIGHVALAEAADIVVIAPATANIIARLAGGIADDMLCCTVLASEAPIVLAPAMNVNMYQNRVTQENLARLGDRGFILCSPAYGRLASGKMGLGRLADIEDILAVVQQVLGREGDLAGRRIVVTAGGTQEPIDPVRHIGNRSSGKMGYAVAEAARNRGAEVVLVSAPTHLPDVVGVTMVRVQTALQMQEAVFEAVARADALVMAAAVADYRPSTEATAKIKKETPTLTLELDRTGDILSQVKGDLVKVGFAAESENLIQNARDKLVKKQLHLIVANDITDARSGFGVDTNSVAIIDRQGRTESLPLLPKREVADRILDRVAELLGSKT